MDRYGLICRSFYENPDVTQRELASILNLSLGTVNKLLGDCLEEAFLMTDMLLSDLISTKRKFNKSSEASRLSLNRV